MTARCGEYLAAERLQSHIRAPRLGYAGVIDELVDLRLIDAVCARQADWHLVMVGPVVLPDARLPRRPNIHWLGEQPCARLPALVAAWDVCLMPLAPGERTRDLLPAQSLQFMAAEKPVVCTGLHDLAAVYGRAVRVARNTTLFIEACKAALGETPQQRVDRLARAARCVSRYSWDEAAGTVQRLLDRSLERTLPMPLGTDPGAAADGLAAGRLTQGAGFSRGGAGARRLAASSSGGTW